MKRKPYVCAYAYTGRRYQILKRIFDNCLIDKDGCYIWQGAHSGSNRPTGGGYGRISINGFTSAVHRVVYITVFGYLPPKRQVDHLCKKRLCCNPNCLEDVTHKQNCKRRDESNKD